MLYPKWAKRLQREGIWNLIERISVQNQLEAKFVAAVVQAESAGNTFATRYEPHFTYLKDEDRLARKIGCTIETMRWMQMSSWGLMQVMGAVAYEHGLENELDWGRRWPSAMVVPAIGLHYGCAHLRLKYRKYGPKLDQVYAAYNAGSPRFNDSGKLINQASVDRVLKFYKELKSVG